MVIGKSTLMLMLVMVTALATMSRQLLVVDALLLMTAGLTWLTLMTKPRLPARTGPVLLAFVILFSVYLVLTLARPSAEGIKNVFGVIVSGGVFFYFAQNARKIAAAPGALTIMATLTALAYLIGASLGVINKNTVSGISAYLLLGVGVLWVVRSPNPNRAALIIFGLVALVGLVQGHRFMLGAGVLAAAIYLALRYVPLGFVRNLGLVVLVGGIVLFIALYAQLWGLDIRDLDAFFIEYTGRTARSGRQIIWPLIIAFVSQSPLTGLGTGATFGNLYNSEWSAHSYFLQIYLQTGLLGLLALSAVLLTVWRAIGRPRRSDPLGVFLTAAFAVLLLHAAFEVFLMQVNLLMGCSAWMMLGLGVGLLRDRTVLDADVQPEDPYVSQGVFS